MAEPMPPAMTSHRPYLLRAGGMDRRQRHDPARAGRCDQPGVRVPAHAVKDGRIVLNIAERAVARLEMGNDVGFTARFGGVSQSVLVPLPGGDRSYACETGHGMALPDDPQGTCRRTRSTADRGAEGLG